MPELATDFNRDAVNNQTTGFFPEGQAAATLNDASRLVMACIAREFQTRHGGVTAAHVNGTDFTVTYQEAMTTLTPRVYCFLLPNAQSEYLLGRININARGYKAVVRADGLPCIAGRDEIPAEAAVVLWYDGTALRLLSHVALVPPLAPIPGPTLIRLTDREETASAVVADGDWYLGGTGAWPASLSGIRLRPIEATRTLLKGKAAEGMLLFVSGKGWGLYAFTGMQDSGSGVGETAAMTRLSSYGSVGTADALSLYLDNAAAALSDTVIGDKAFSNPPTDLTSAEKTAAREAIGGLAIPSAPLILAGGADSLVLSSTAETPFFSAPPAGAIYLLQCTLADDTEYQFWVFRDEVALGARSVALGDGTLTLRHSLGSFTAQWNRASEELALALRRLA